MKVFFFNPNSDEKMAAAIQATAELYNPGALEIECRATPGAPEFIETYEDIAAAGPAMLRLFKEHEESSDAFVIACHYDPNLDALKKITCKPVVGIGEASIKTASMLGNKFSIITTESHSIPIHAELVRKYGLQNSLASVRAPKNDGESDLLSAAVEAVNQDKAEVIVLGCAGMTGLDKKLQAELGIPVLDGVVCAMFITAGLARYGIHNTVTDYI